MIVSDNGTTFKGAAKSIRAVKEHPEVQCFMSGVNGVLTMRECHGGEDFLKGQFNS